jgi:Sulfotransferase domain
MENNRPDFLIIGAAKAATTMLSSMLDQHPQAGIVQGKEPHFFSMDPVYARGWSWYQSGFQRCQGKSVLGDASTSYSRIRYHPKTVSRILRHIPNVKIIYMVRHPLDRIESAYIERLASIDADHGYPSINHAVRSEPMMIDSSRYWEVFDYYRQYFEEKYIKIIWFEEFISDTDNVFRGVCKFLGIDDNAVVDPKRAYQNTRADVLQAMNRINTGSVPQYNLNWSPETKHWVLDQIREDNNKLLQYFGKPEDYWSYLQEK